MQDGFLRRALKAVARGFFRINLHGTRTLMRLRGEKPWQLGGSCGKCAACCEAPSIQVGKMTWYLPTVRRLFLWWHRRVNGFELVERDVKYRVFVFRCTHFDPVTRRCDSYDSRPGMCRDYPRALLWSGSPQFLTGCGYRAIDPGGKKLLDALAAEGVDAAKLEKARSRLKVE